MSIKELYRKDWSIKSLLQEISTLKDKIRRRNMQIKDRNKKIAELEKNLSKYVDYVFEKRLAIDFADWSLKL